MAKNAILPVVSVSNMSGDSREVIVQQSSLMFLATLSPVVCELSSAKSFFSSVIGW